jgi:hypothetical protein
MKRENEEHLMRSRNWLCLGPVLFCLLDGGLTLHGQPDAYWDGDYEQVLEWNPLGRSSLQQHPFLFVLSLVAWAAIFTSLVLTLSINLARPLSFAVQLGHTIGAASWLARLGALGWVGVLLLFWFSRLLLDWTWRRAGTQETNTTIRKPHPGGSPA